MRNVLKGLVPKHANVLEGLVPKHANILEGLVAKHVNERQWIGWNEARIMQIETERYRKNKK
jgi:hypothetical protein